MSKYKKIESMDEAIKAIDTNRLCYVKEPFWGYLESSYNLSTKLEGLLLNLEDLKKISNKTDSEIIYYIKQEPEYVQIESFEELENELEKDNLIYFKRKLSEEESRMYVPSIHRTLERLLVDIRTGKYYKKNKTKE